MLKIITTEKSVYNSKSLEERKLPETLFLCRDTNTGLCSIYYNDECYGENIDEASIEDQINIVKAELGRFKIMTNKDILAIISS